VKGVPLLCSTPSHLLTTPAHPPSLSTPTAHPTQIPAALGVLDDITLGPYSIMDAEHLHPHIAGACGLRPCNRLRCCGGARLRLAAHATAVAPTATANRPLPDVSPKNNNRKVLFFGRLPRARGGHEGVLVKRRMCDTETK
jgi:hypothetical protein